MKSIALVLAFSLGLPILQGCVKQRDFVPLITVYKSDGPGVAAWLREAKIPFETETSIGWMFAVEPRQWHRGKEVLESAGYKESLFWPAKTTFPAGSSEPATNPAPAEIDDGRALAGNYFMMDGMGGGFLDLRADGNFRCLRSGCGGPDGTARGTWRRAEHRVEFIDEKSTGTLEGFFVGASVASDRDTFALVLDQFAEQLQSSKLNTNIAFRRASRLSPNYKQAVEDEFRKMGWTN